MSSLPNKLYKKLQHRIDLDTLRTLSDIEYQVDFFSNDYLGFARSGNIFNSAHQLVVDYKLGYNGSTGSRLISGNHQFYIEVEKQLATFFNAEAALVFNSGYDANVGFFSSIPQRGDVILYDEYIHASIRDGIQMSNARSFKFKHNDVEDLDQKLFKIQQNPTHNADQHIYVVTESVFSMDGDTPQLLDLVRLCEQRSVYLIIDEAHAVGVFGHKGEGLLQQLGVEDKVFARINTFGKAIGCHGAVVLGSNELKSYLVNFARSFMYTTGLSPHALATIKTSFDELKHTMNRKKLHKNISFFAQEVKENQLEELFIPSISAIHCCVIAGNIKVKEIASIIQNQSFGVKPILSPTIPKGKERLRFCIHSYNTEEEMTKVLQLVATFVKDQNQRIC